MWQKERAEPVQCSLQVQNTGGPRGCRVDPIRHDCHQPESSQRSLISHILKDIPFCFFQQCPFKGTGLFQLFHDPERGREDGEPSTLYLGGHILRYWQIYNDIDHSNDK